MWNPVLTVLQTVESLIQMEASMQIRTLGTQGLQVSALGLGTMGMTGIPGLPNMYGASDEAESISTIHRALDLGIHFFDTAEIYGPFTNEALLGKALRDRRDRAVIATKFAYEFDSQGRPLHLNSRPEHLVKSLDGSLKRLGVDYIDLWYQHRVDPTVPIEETVGAMAEQVKAGKVRYLGLSEANVTTIRRAHAVHPITALQTEYSLWERHIEVEILPTLRELGIGFVAYSPLGRGLLTGQARPATDYPADDYRCLDPRYQAENFARNQVIVTLLQEMAVQKAATPAQLVLAWLLHQGQDIVPIPGTKRRQYLEENAAAAGVCLLPEELAVLNSAAPLGGTAGERYDAERFAAINR